MRLTNDTTGEVIKVMHRKPLLTKTKGEQSPRILIFDIETTPMLSYHWRSYQENIQPSQVMKHSRVLCWAAKWLGEEFIYFDSTQGEDDDLRICETLWVLCDKANLLVAHNGQAFDVSFMNTRWLYYNIAPPSPTKVVDTLKLARKVFKFSHNKLDSIARYLGLGEKSEHEGFGLWLKCMSGDKEAWKRMEEYNINDTLLLEEIYIRLRAFDKQHPNVSLFYDDLETRCVVCGDTSLTQISKDATTNVSSFPAYRCNKCGKVMRRGQRYKHKDVLRNAL